jgi:cytoskeletal protein CcmA (bactofilin family)
MTVDAHPVDSLPARRAVDDATRDAAADVWVVVPVSGRFEGLLTFRGSARLDGEFKGEIVCRGSLHVGVHARVTGTIEVDELIVSGSLEGEVTARERIQLTATARVKGVIRAPRVALEEGCVLDGRCETCAPASDA